MARIRTIKPEFWTSEQIAECSPIARLLFIGLWNFCDDQGIHPDNAKRIKMEVFPGDAFYVAEVENLVAELARHGLLRRYVVNGEAYLQVTGWAKHQKIEKPSKKYPPPIADDSPNGRRSVADSSPPDVDVDVEGNGSIPPLPPKRDEEGKNIDARADGEIDLSIPECLRRTPPVQTRIVAGGFKQIGAGKRLKNPRNADAAMEAFLAGHCGMDELTARNTVSAARTPGAEGHRKAREFCLQISRENKLGWFHEEAGL